LKNFTFRENNFREFRFYFFSGKNEKGEKSRKVYAPKVYGFLEPFFYENNMMADYN